MSAPRLLSVERLSARSTRDGGKPILRDVSLAVAPREIHGLVGESGAGKSTIARAILGILPFSVEVTSGAVILSATELLTLELKQRRRLLGTEVALIPQDPMTALNPSRKIEAQLTDGLRMWKGYSRKAARKCALDLLEEVQMREPEKVMRSFPHELSGGMRQRVLIAAAFALEPKLIVADEPTTALDVTVQKQILRLIRAMQERHGTAAIFVTHDLGVVAQICDRTTVLFQGRVVEQGSTARILSAPDHAYTRALIEATPRYDRPGQGIVPISEHVLATCRAEIEAFDRGGHA